MFICHLYTADESNTSFVSFLPFVMLLQNGTGLDQKTGPGNLLPGERDQRMTGPGIYGTENVHDHLQSVDLQPIKVEENSEADPTHFQEPQ